MYSENDFRYYQEAHLAHADEKSKWKWLPGGKNPPDYNKWYYETVTKVKNAAKKAGEDIAEGAKTAVENTKEFVTGDKAEKDLHAAQLYSKWDNSHLEASKRDMHNRTGTQYEQASRNMVKEAEQYAKDSNKALEKAQNAYKKTLPGMVNTAKTTLGNVKNSLTVENLKEKSGYNARKRRDEADAAASRSREAVTEQHKNISRKYQAANRLEQAGKERGGNSETGQSIVKNLRKEANEDMRYMDSALGTNTRYKEATKKQAQAQKEYDKTPMGKVENAAKKVSDRAQEEISEARASMEQAARRVASAAESAAGKAGDTYKTAQQELKKQVEDYRQTLSEFTDEQLASGQQIISDLLGKYLK